MRVLVLQPPARDEGAGLDQRLDDRLVGIALVPLVVEHAAADEARRIRGEEAVRVNGIRNARIDVPIAQHAIVGHPDVEVVAAVTRRSMDEARACVIGDMVAVEERHHEAVIRPKQRMDRRHHLKVRGIESHYRFEI